MKVSTLSVIVLLAACSDDKKNGDPTDTTAADTTVAEETTVAPDTSTPDDTAEPADTTVIEDTTAPEETSTPSDTVADSETFEPDTKGCEYFEEPRVLECGGSNSITSFLEWVSADEGCSPYFTAGDTAYPTLEALADGEHCQTDCVWRLRTAVMFFVCTGEAPAARNEYMVYGADGEGCPDLYGTPAGLLRNLCQWQERSCYCKDSDGDHVSDGRADGENLGGSDNCDDVANPTQQDDDGDYFGNACDPDIDGDGTANGEDDDIDGDLVLNGDDQCPNGADPVMDCDGNPETPDRQCDSDGDGTNDGCDPCPYAATDDADHDEVCDDIDNCPTVANPVSDCDDNPSTQDEQCDSDFNGTGDACEAP